MTSKPPGKRSKPRRRPFSALTGRIVALNIVALAFLVGGVLYLDQFRTGLVDTRLSALLTQAEVIAGAVGEAATGGPEATTIDGARARQILRRLVVPTHIRARLFDSSGALLVDSRDLFARSEVFETRLPPPGLWNKIIAESVQAYESVIMFLARGMPLQTYTEKVGQRALDYEEAVAALAGTTATAVRTGDGGSLVLSAAVPVQRFKRVLGVLLASVETSEIEEMVRQERLAILEIFFIALAVTVLLSYALALTIARPVHRLAEVADKVSRGYGRNIQIPDFSKRRDEIGDLSRALRDMTEALYRRIDGIEAFAADVAHEIKNPLTSLRSAVETLERTGDAEKQAKLFQIVKDDVRRIDRLISDISNASRLDAELSRADMGAVDIGAMLKTLVEVYSSTARPEGPRISLDIPADDALVVRGLENGLGQVVRNILDNAVSFSRGRANRPVGKIAIAATRGDDEIVITIDDDGPGIPEAMLDDIFDRFYTERPEDEVFGTHSGLGLSISKQIIEAHDGSIEAQNRLCEPPADGAPSDQDDGGEGEQAKVLGARFIIRLPA